MKRSELEHVLRAAGQVIAADRIIVVGSRSASRSTISGSPSSLRADPKDLECCRALVRAQLISPHIVRERAPFIDPRADAAILVERVERLLADA